MAVWSRFWDFLHRYRMVTVAALQMVLCGVAYYLAFALRLDNLRPWTEEYGWFFWRALPIVLVLRLGTFIPFDLLRGLWRYVSISDLLNIFRAVTLGSAIFALIVVLGLAKGSLYSTSIFVLDWAFCILLLGGVRFVIRTFRETFVPMQRGRKRVLIVGAGDAGEMLLREMRTHTHLSYQAVGFVDDDPRKRNLKIHGVKVLGRIDEIGEIVIRERVEDVIVSIPSASGAEMERILETCRDVPIRLRHLPTVGDIVRITQIRDVELEDLLGREPVRLDEERMRAELEGRRILVTGAGGSIGSELVRQIAVFRPERVVLLDWSENALFYLERELLDRFEDLEFRLVVGDIQDEDRMEQLFAEERFHHVFHAAAFKHVPLMETNPVEAVKNNVGGTGVLSGCAARHGVLKFVLISTDKAVRPTSVMGASKRAAELLLSTMPADKTQFISVRFGNVLGSQGSVVPLFKRQILEGGPVTVTDPEVVRYFMTIPEAVQLVLQAGAMGEGGEVFVLDMGQPVKIADLARKLISLSGFRPDVDIPIRYIGMRPGEKLYEELLIEDEGVGRTAHEKIMILDGEHPSLETMRGRIDALLRGAGEGDANKVIRALAKVVPEYEPKNPAWSEILGGAAEEGEP